MSEEPFSEGPFTDEMVRHYVKIVQTQTGIIKYAEAMAQVLAEAGMASNKATGDSARHAVRSWGQVIIDRALDIVGARQVPDKLKRLPKHE